VYGRVNAVDSGGENGDRLSAPFERPFVSGSVDSKRAAANDGNASFYKSLGELMSACFAIGRSRTGTNDRNGWLIEAFGRALYEHGGRDVPALLKLLGIVVELKDVNALSDRLLQGRHINRLETPSLPFGKGRMAKQPVDRIGSKRTEFF